jgi:CheY-like chemotaxis protein
MSHTHDRKQGVILVVDDDAAIREAMRDTLEDEGYEVATAVCGADALTYLRTHAPPALIFVDWNMAPMNAPQFMTEFAKEPAFAHVPVVLITADMKADHKVTTAEYQGLIRKPVNLDMLFDIAKRFAAVRAEHAN